LGELSSGFSPAFAACLASRMPKTPGRDDYFTQSFRFTPEQTAFLKEGAKRLGSTTALVREVLDDARTLYGLPMAMVEALEKDRRALGLSPREYIMHLLARRYERVLSQGPAFDTKKSKK